MKNYSYYYIQIGERSANFQHIEQINFNAIQHGISFAIGFLQVSISGSPYPLVPGIFLDADYNRQWPRQTSPVLSGCFLNFHLL